VDKVLKITTIVYSTALQIQNLAPTVHFRIGSSNSDEERNGNKMLAERSVEI
jgi:hypothetical protein